MRCRTRSSRAGWPPKAGCFRNLYGRPGQVGHRRSLHGRAQFRDRAAAARHPAGLQKGAATRLCAGGLFWAGATTDLDSRSPRSRLAANRSTPPLRMGPVPVRDLKLLWRLVWRIALRQPRALWSFAGVFIKCARRNPSSLECVGVMAALYLHLGPFARLVITSLDEQIGQIDAGEWRSPLSDTPRAINAAPVPVAANV